MRSKLSILLVTYSLVGLGFGCGKETAKPSPNGKGKGGPPKARVQVATVEAGTLDSEVSFLGNARSAFSTPVAAAVAGTVSEVQVREGQAVDKDSVMVELDARRIRSEVSAALALQRRTEAQLAQARKQAQRAKGVSKEDLSASEKERYDLAVTVLAAQLASERANLQRIRVDLSHHKILAPFAGVVMSRQVNPGAWVSVGATVVELVSTEEIEVFVDVPFDIGGRAKVGDLAVFHTEGLSVASVVAGVVPALDESTRTMRLRLEVADKAKRPSWLIPGLAVDVRLAVEVSGEGVLVPRDAVIRGPVRSRVVKVVDGVGEPVPVELLGSTVERALVRGEGLVVGDKVMTRGNERYRPGTPVVIEQ